MRVTQVPHKIVVDGDMSASSITSAVHQVEHQWLLSIQAKWTGTPVGIIKIQACCDDDLGYVDITDSSVSVAGSADGFVWNYSLVGYKSIKVVYTKSSSTGTLQVSVWSKGN